MRCFTVCAFAVPLAAIVACGGKAQSAGAPGAPGADTTEAAKAPAAQVTPDSAATPGSDSAAKPTAPAAAPAATKPDSAKVEKGDYDKAGRPKFKIDEKTGTITPIRKP